MGMNNWAVEKTGDTAAEFQGPGQSTGVKNAKNSIADTLHKVAEALAGKAANQDAPSGIAQYGKQASEWLDQSAEYVRQFDYKQADAKAREYVRQSPGRSLLIAGVAGLILGAIFRRR
jgi:ElaB/YqjD/DUF883 family membrane-anchored ribosome-binding protein